MLLKTIIIISAVWILGTSVYFASKKPQKEKKKDEDSIISPVKRKIVINIIPDGRKIEDITGDIVLHINELLDGTYKVPINLKEGFDPLEGLIKEKEQVSDKAKELLNEDEEIMDISQIKFKKDENEN